MNVAGDILWKVADFPEAQVLASRWRRIIPPNILGDAPNPQFTEAMKQASDKIEQQLAVITKQTQELADKNREFELKEAQLKIEQDKIAVEQQRLDYEAETKRVVALGNSGPAISVEQIQPVLKQLLAGMVANGELVYNAPEIGNGGTPLQPQEQDTENMQDQEQSAENEPPVEGAQLAPDGEWYVESPEGGYMRVE